LEALGDEVFNVEEEATIPSYLTTNEPLPDIPTEDFKQEEKKEVYMNNN
jgi:hypothetical protein